MIARRTQSDCRVTAAVVFSIARRRPSPGSVYPTLGQLEDEGLIRSAESEGGSLFEITVAGRQHLGTRADQPDPWNPAADYWPPSFPRTG